MNVPVIMRRRRGMGSPSGLYGAEYAWDFQSGRYAIGGSWVSLSDAITFTESGGTFIGPDGVLTEQATDQLRIEYSDGVRVGAWIEPGSVNEITNALDYTPDAESSPAAVTSATTLFGRDALAVDMSAAGTDAMWSYTNHTVLANTQYTFSQTVKLGTATEVRLVVFGEGFGWIVPLDSAPALTADGTAATTFTTPAGVTQIRLYSWRREQTVPETFGTFTMLGRQLERGATATSRVLSSGSAKARSQAMLLHGFVPSTSYTVTLYRADGTTLAAAVTSNSSGKIDMGDVFASGPGGLVPLMVAT